MKSALLVPLIAFSLLSLAQAADPKPAREGTMALLGSWKIVTFEANGRAKDEPIGATVSFDGKTMAVKLRDHDTEQGSYRLDTGKSPMHLDLTIVKDDETRVHQNIYKIEGETLTIVFNERRQPRPKSFDVGEGDNYELIILKRVEADREKK